MSNELSILSKRFFPAFYENEAPRLIQFFKYYLEWMQQENNPYWTVDNLSDFTSIRGSIDTYLDHLKYELMVDFPLEYAGDLRYMMRNLVMLYQSKGTLKAYKFFFRAIYDSICTIWYPRELILKPSDGKWIVGYYVYSDDIPLNMIMGINGANVTEKETGYTGIVTNVIPHKYGDEDEYRYSLVITDYIWTFTQGNTLIFDGFEGEYELTLAEFDDGYWSNNDGKLDSEMVLQDSYYYQQFSYELTTTVQFDVWRDVVLKLLHPAGLKLFARYKLTDDSDLENPIGCNGNEINTSIINWWILKIYMYVEKWETELLLEWWIILHNGFGTYTFPYTADNQLWEKRFDKVYGVKDLTPNDLYKQTNDSNKMIFVDCLLKEDATWGDWQLNSEALHYEIAGIRCKYPVWRTTCTDGRIEMEIDYGDAGSINDRELSDKLFVFVNGAKVRDDRISRDETGINCADTADGTAVVYSLEPDCVAQEITQELTENWVSIPGVHFTNLLIFINGEFVWESCRYDLESGVLTLPTSSGYLELYEVTTNQDTSVGHYKFNNINSTNEKNTLYCRNPLLNINVDRDQNVRLAGGDPFTMTRAYNTDGVPFVAYRAPEVRIRAKNYGETRNVMFWNPMELMTNTNTAKKMVFWGTKQIFPDWLDGTLPTIHNVDYMIASVPSKYTRARTWVDSDGEVDLTLYFPEGEIPDSSDAMPFVFVNGYKVPDAHVEHTSTGFQIPENWVSSKTEVQIYFLDPTRIKKIFSIDNEDATREDFVETDVDTLFLQSSTKERLLIFQDGKWEWQSAIYRVGDKESTHGQCPMVYPNWQNQVVCWNGLYMHSDYGTMDMYDENQAPDWYGVTKVGYLHLIRRSGWTEVYEMEAHEDCRVVNYYNPEDPYKNPSDSIQICNPVHDKFVFVDLKITNS